MLINFAWEVLDVQKYAALYSLYVFKDHLPRILLIILLRAVFAWFLTTPAMCPSTSITKNPTGRSVVHYTALISNLHTEWKLGGKLLLRLFGNLCYDTCVWKLCSKPLKVIWEHGFSSSLEFDRHGMKCFISNNCYNIKCKALLLELNSALIITFLET